MSPVDLLFVFGAKYLYLIIVLGSLATLIALDSAQRKRFILLAAVSLPIVYAAAKIGSHLWYDPRPFVVGNFTPLIPHAPDNGFPSDHALISFAFASLAFFFKKNVAYALLLLALLVAISRVYVGVHHIIDVAGSAMIACAGVFLAHTLLQRLWTTAPQNSE